MAEAHLALGERSEAVATAGEGIALACAGGCYYWEAQAQLALAAALLATDGVVPRAEIESALEHVEQLVESIEARSLSPRILEQRGRLAAAIGDAPAASRALQEALDLYPRHRRHRPRRKPRAGAGSMNCARWRCATRPRAVARYPSA